MRDISFLVRTLRERLAERGTLNRDEFTLWMKNIKWKETEEYSERLRHACFLIKGENSYSNDFDYGMPVFYFELNNFPSMQNS